VFGIDAYVVEVEVDIGSRPSHLCNRRLPEGQSRHPKIGSRQLSRIVAMTFLPRRITVNLAPADIKKEGRPSSSMAIGILAATEVVQKKQIGPLFYFG